MNRRRSAPTARASSPRVQTGRRRSGTPAPAPWSSRSRGTPQPSVRRRSAPTARASSPRVKTRRRRSGTPGPAPRSSPSSGTTIGPVWRIIQPRRLAASSPRAGQHGEGLGRDDAAPSSSPLKGHDRPVPSRRRSAPTARASSPRARTGRRRSGTPGPAPRSLTLKGHAGPLVLGVVQPRRLADRHRESDDATAKVWDARTGALSPHAQGAHRRKSTRRRSAPTARASSPRVMTGRRRSGTPGPAPRSSPSRGTPTHVQSASFSPDGSRIVTGSCDGTAKVWDAQIGAEVLTLKGHAGVVLRRRSAPTGRASSPELRQDGKGLGRQDRRRGPRLKGHTQRLISASFSPDGSRIVTASAADNTAKVWDAKTGAEILAFKGQSQ